MHSEKLSFPAFSQDRRSRRLAIRVRKIYKTVLRILEHTKSKKPRRVTLLCSQLQNSPVLQYLPLTKNFSNLVSYHVSSGKFRKNSYKVLMKMAHAPLGELEPKIKASKDLVSAKPVAVNALVKKSKPKQQQVPRTKKTEFSFSALEDLERIKKLVIERKSETVESIIKSEITITKPVVKSKEATKAKDKTAKSNKPEKKKTDDSGSDEVEDIARSITKDDELVFRALSKEKDRIDIELGEARLLKRGVVMFGTHIPQMIWKKVFTQLGLQIVARQYVTAMYAPVIASPTEQDGDVFAPEAILNHANQLLALHNRRQANDCQKLGIVGDPFHIKSSTHAWFLCLPLCVINSTSFRFGHWSFTKNPSARTAVLAEVA